MIVYTAEVYSKYLEHVSIYLGGVLQKSDIDRIKELYMKQNFQNGDPWYDRIEVVEHKVERECDVCGGGHTTIVVGTYTNPMKKFGEDLIKFIRKNQRHDFFILQEFDDDEKTVHYSSEFTNLEDALYNFEYGTYAYSKLKRVIAESKDGSFEGIIISNF